MVRKDVPIQGLALRQKFLDFLTETSARLVRVFRLLWATVATFVESSNETGEK